MSGHKPLTQGWQVASSASKYTHTKEVKSQDLLLASSGNRAGEGGGIRSMGRAGNREQGGRCLLLTRRLGQRSLNFEGAQL